MKRSQASDCSVSPKRNSDADIFPGFLKETLEVLWETRKVVEMLGIALQGEIKTKLANIDQHIAKLGGLSSFEPSPRNRTLKVKAYFERLSSDEVVSAQQVARATAEPLPPVRSLLHKLAKDGIIRRAPGENRWMRGIPRLLGIEMQESTIPGVRALTIKGVKPNPPRNDFETESETESEPKSESESKSDDVLILE